MGDRYYLPELMGPGPFELTGSELHHARHVLRLEPGARLVVFDGEGNEADAEIADADRHAMTLRILDRRPTPPSEARAVILATAVPKGDRARWLVEKGTELGVAQWIPLQSARSVVDPRTAKLDRLRQTVIEACKQSGRNRLMKIEAPQSWSEFVQTLVPTAEALIADPQGELEAGPRSNGDRRPLLLIVGPEGGWTEEELRQAAAVGARRVSLGTNILRVETAALAMVARFAGLSRSSEMQASALARSGSAPVSLADFHNLVAGGLEGLLQQHEERGLAEEFVTTVEDPENRVRLRMAFAQDDGTEAFEAALYRCKIAHDWFRFRDDRIAQHLKSWLETHGVAYVNDGPQHD